MRRIKTFLKNLLFLFRFDRAMMKMWNAWMYIDDWRAEQLLWSVILEMEERRKHLFETKLGTCLSSTGQRSPKEHYETTECDEWKESVQ